VFRPGERVVLQLMAELQYGGHTHTARCKDACGKCMDICSFGAIESDLDGRYTVIDSLCMGCGICKEICLR